MRTGTGLTIGVMVVVVGAAVWLRSPASSRGSVDPPPRRLEAIRRAGVWNDTDVRSKDLRAGPAGAEAFQPEQLVECDYVDATFEGNTPKFECAVRPGDRVKVKYGAGNGEVYAEVAATRLLWALGFGADRVYPVRVQCHGCPRDFKGPAEPSRTALVDPAAVERKFESRPLGAKAHSGWSWPELDLVDAAAGGAPRSQLDALRLLAALLQHTDSKASNQRLVLLPDGRPFLLINDVGMTFGRANFMNRDRVGSVDFEAWSRTPVWTGGSGCVAAIERSFTGTLDHPVIGEPGRALLSRLLDDLSDAQLADLFDVARFPRRSGHPVADWVRAFARKRDEVRGRRCGG